MVKEYAHFRLDGEEFTRIARDFFLSEKPDLAVQLFTEGLSGCAPGEAEHYAKLVLDGKMKLVGNETDGLTPAEDDAAGYIGEARYIYSGRVRVDGRWWRPRAKVTNFGPDDMPIGPIPTFYGLGKRAREKELGRARVKFYAGPEERVLLDDVIFEPCGEPPHWWKRNQNPTMALEDFLRAGRQLDEDGWFQRFGHFQVETEPQAPEINWAEPDRRDAERQDQRKVRLADVKRRVLEQAAGDFYDLTLPDGKTVPVPRAPFFHWALRQTSLAHMAPPWKVVSQSGEKMIGDDPFHTDWVIGAGFSFEEAYDGPIKDASWDARFLLQDTLGNFEAAVIVGGEDVSGQIGKDILVLPDLRPEHLEKLIGMKAVITEKGGRLAHLAIVALERSVPIMLVPDALTRFPRGTQVTLRISEGKIEIHDVCLSSIRGPGVP